jgi:DNA-binding response OmpR family regulator
MVPPNPTARAPGKLSLPQTVDDLRTAIVAGFPAPAGAALADKLTEAGLYPVVVASAHHAMAVARVRDVALVAIDAEHLHESASQLIRDLRALPVGSASARIMIMAFYLPESLRENLTEAGVDAIVTMLDDDTTHRALDAMLGRA